jgi:demethylmenaquinone methyltransferase/2-methoxy-6-polyprenyl-1,4-benzoquinol methylase
VAIALRKLGPQKITGIDLSEGMLAIGRKKVQQKGLSHLIELKKADSENLPFTDRQFDAVTVAFGGKELRKFTSGASGNEPGAQRGR